MRIELSKINEALRTDPKEYIAFCDARYDRRVGAAADAVKEHLSKSRVILLAGPSSSGKTTTAGRVRKALEKRGIFCHMISLDDYYRSKTEPGYPLTPEGEPDLETPLALDLDLLNEHLSKLDRGEEIMVPHFSFPLQRRVEEEAWPLRLGENEAVVFEGIHGLNPLLTDHHPEATRLFVSTATSIYDGDIEVFDRVWMRVIRRMVRDFNFRSADAEETLGLWRNVRLGEKHYISPYKETAHIAIDTTHGYEVSAFRSTAEPMLKAVQNNPQPRLTKNILEGLESFEPLSLDLLPETCLLKEEFLPKD